MTLDNKPRQNPQRRASHPSLVLCPSQCRNQRALTSLSSVFSKQDDVASKKWSDLWDEDSKRKNKRSSSKHAKCRLRGPGVMGANWKIVPVQCVLENRWSRIAL